MATTKKYWTWAEIYSKMKSELDLDEETFIDEDEMREYANDAIDVIESHVMTLNADYFLTRQTLTLVDGTDSYDLPTNIYGMKLRGVIYFKGTDHYEIERIRDWYKFMEYRCLRINANSSDDYRYFLYNEVAGSPQLLISPPSFEDGEYVELWFLRRANRLETGTDVCDIPEFISYIFDYMRERVSYKEAAGSAKHVMAREDRDATLARAIDTLSVIVPDNNNEIEQDTSFYEEMA